MDRIGTRLVTRLAGDPGVTVRHLEAPRALRAVLRGVDKLFLALPAGEDPVAYADAVLEAARAERITHLVHVSSDPEVDRRIRASGIPYTLLRHHAPVDPRQIADVAAIALADEEHSGRTFVLRAVA
ncbi:MAG TPA: hypothetical protein VLX92_16425 [Kofleriaceae bacterium]|nr:hypothetical protein [Kofleriaceae bacterium]